MDTSWQRQRLLSCCWFSGVQGARVELYSLATQHVGRLVQTSQPTESERVAQVVWARLAARGVRQLCLIMDGPPVNVEDYQAHARRILPKMVYDYYAGGAETEWTARENCSAFSKYRLLPRMLRDVSAVDMSTNLLGHHLQFPVIVAPTAMQRMAHPDGELATARATAVAGSLMVLSTMSTTSLEDVAGAVPASAGASPRWFQLYVMKTRELTRALVERAERAGYTGLVLTVDTPITGSREDDIRNRFTLPEGLQLANLDHLQQAKMDNSAGSGLTALFASQIDDSLTFEIISWLKSITTMPIIVKGVLRGSDAVSAIEYGASAIIVSNHGGRQADYAPATIDVLAEVVSKVQGRVPVLLDGGIRRGSDILKALAMGAQAVLIGRPVLWGLAYGGEQGVSQVLQMLHRELKLAMMLNGCKSVACADADLLFPIHAGLVSKL